MRKIVLSGFACLFMTAVIANGFTPEHSGSRKFSCLESKSAISAQTTNDDVREIPSNDQGLYHITKIKGTTDKYLLMIAKMPSTKVLISIYDEKGNLIYNGTKNAKTDVAQVLKITYSDRVRFTLTDNHGGTKEYSFNKLSD